MTAKTMNRETWLNALAEKMAPRFAQLGWPLPAFRVAVGFTSSGRVSHIGGECWHKSKSDDGRFEILIAPHVAESMQAAAILAHELTHAAVGFEHGHKGDFAKCMAQLGMQRPFTNSIAGPAFKEFAQPFLDALGAFPHSRLNFDKQTQAPKPITRRDDQAADDGELEEDSDDGAVVGVGSSNAKKKQSTRLVKAACGECGYTVRVTRRWLEVGAPHCPLHGAMDVEVSDDGDA